MRRMSTTNTAAQAYAVSHRIKFYWTPTNASWLNRIECQFTALKKFALDNTDHRTHREQQQTIRHHLSWRNRRRRITLQPWTASRHMTRVAA
jgi:transposase